jgi:RNA polymerase sigma-70 factor (ECF subfamily)
MRLLLEHDRQLKAYAVSLVAHWADAEDILQNAKLELWQRFAEYDPAGNFGAWARKIIYYQVLTFRKTKGRQRARFSQAAFELVAAEAAAAANEADGRFSALIACIEKLTQASRILLWRCSGGKATAKDAALGLGRSVRGTQRAVAKIRRELQECVERELRREEHP